MLGRPVIARVPVRVGDRPGGRRRCAGRPRCPSRWPAPRRCCAPGLGVRRHPAGAGRREPVRRRPTPGSSSAVHARLLAVPALDELAGPGRERAVRAHLGELLREEEPLLPGARVTRGWLGELAHEVAGLGPLEPLLADPSVTEVMVNGPGRCFVERDGRLEPVAARPRRRRDPADRRADPRAARAAARPGVADGRRAPARRLAPARGDPTARDRRAVRHDPAVRRARRSPLEEFGAGRRRRGVPALGGRGRVEPRRLRRHERRQDHAAQRAVGRDPGRRADHHDRGDRRAAARAAARRPARGPARRTPRAPAASRCATSCAPRCGCDPTGSWSARCAAREALDLLQALNTGHDGSLSTVHANGAGDALAPARDARAARRDRAAARGGARAGRRRGRRRRAGRRGAGAASAASRPSASSSPRPQGSPSASCSRGGRGGSCRPGATRAAAARRPEAPAPDARWFSC